MLDLLCAETQQNLERLWRITALILKKLFFGCLKTSLMLSRLPDRHLWWKSKTIRIRVREIEKAAESEPEAPNGQRMNKKALFYPQTVVRAKPVAFSAAASHSAFRKTTFFDATFSGGLEGPERVLHHERNSAPLLRRVHFLFIISFPPLHRRQVR